MKSPFLYAPLLSLFLLVGCDQTPPAEVTALQGSWKGKDTAENKDVVLTISGRSADFKYGDQSYKGSYGITPGEPKQLTAKIVESTVQSYVGQEAKFIYKIEGGTLTMSGFGPGKGFPATFDQEGARRMVLKK